MALTLTSDERTAVERRVRSPGERSRQRDRVAGGHLPDPRREGAVRLRTQFDRNKCVTGLAAPCPAINP